MRHAAKLQQVPKIVIVNVAVLLLSLTITILTAAQNQPLTFEAGSIHSMSFERGFHGGSCHGVDSKHQPQSASIPPLGRCVFSNVGLRGLIESAYRLGPFLIVSGGDKWVDSDAFRVEGVAENPQQATEEELVLMLRHLLQNRFRLRFHQENREEQGFALVIGRNGPKLHLSAQKSTRPGVMVIAQDAEGHSAKGEGLDLQTFANFLSADLQQPVEDRTELDGFYNIVLKWTRSPVEIHDSAEGPADPEGPSLFTALQEQLGLRLERRKVTIPVIVIDHAEKPDAN